MPSARRSPSSTPLSIDWPAPAGFRAITARLQKQVQRRTGCAEDARDLVQDAWLRLLEQGDAARRLREPAAWLSAVAHHLTLDHLRQRQAAARCGLPRQGSHSSHGSGDGDGHHDGDDDAPIAPWQAQPDAAESLMYRQALDAVQAALHALPERARQAFLAHRLHGTPQSELAARHGVSLATIERDVQQASARLHAALLHWRGEHPQANANASANASNERPAPPRRRSLTALLGLAALSGSGLLGWRAWQHSAARPLLALALHTPRGQLARQALPDGSALTLDAASRAHITYRRALRHVQLLHGALFAEVAHDPQRPFVVEAALPQPAAATTADSPADATATSTAQAAPDAPDARPRVRITVLGTRFSVDIAPAGIDVRVAQGRVRVEWLDAGGQPRSQRELHPGQGLRLSAASPAPIELPASSAASPGDDADQHAAPWRHGHLRFHAEPLAHAIARLARYQREDAAPIKLDPRVASLAISGQAPLRHAHDWLQSLPAVLPVTVRRQGQGWHIAPRANPRTRR
ncbi:sigma-70 family RNA polymerase sigma factor [Allofranklinella schreckenbergeri]|uniref:Sigma-70 family RNA polymerase sigma factor n=1 Tax=Allofranklinella schreckenbergeri TaxID=1076744 RepID=A0A3M6Q8E3_9BURK|nr:sigma-70 family RNA polymerase sigma factor [Allofranklinella schreckenbergeri]RMW98668.1 sigma-70 family RNA polymerase sigma factor [Allofranklinella schreckenbergeri]